MRHEANNIAPPRLCQRQCATHNTKCGTQQRTPPPRNARHGVCKGTHTCNMRPPQCEAPHALYCAYIHRARWLSTSGHEPPIHPVACQHIQGRDVPLHAAGDRAGTAAASVPHEALYPTVRYPTRRGNRATETYPNTPLELLQALQRPWQPFACLARRLVLFSTSAAELLDRRGASSSVYSTGTALLKVRTRLPPTTHAHTHSQPPRVPCPLARTTCNSQQTACITEDHAKFYVAQVVLALEALQEKKYVYRCTLHCAAANTCH